MPFAWKIRWKHFVCRWTISIWECGHCCDHHFHLFVCKYVCVVHLPLKNSLTWKYFYEQCANDSLGRINNRHWLAIQKSLLNAFRIQSQCSDSIQFVWRESTAHTCHISRVRQPNTYSSQQQYDDGEIHSFVFNGQKSVIAFSASIFHLAIFKWDDAFFFFAFCLFFRCCYPYTFDIHYYQFKHF